MGDKELYCFETVNKRLIDYKLAIYSHAGCEIKQEIDL